MQVQGWAIMRMLFPAVRQLEAKFDRLEAAHQAAQIGTGFFDRRHIRIDEGGVAPMLSAAAGEPAPPDESLSNH